MKKKILFLHYNLHGGGAERVLVNLLKFIDLSKYDITLKTIFGKGVHVKDVPDGIKYSSVFKREIKGFNTIMKLLPGSVWHRLFIRGHYDIEVGFIENSPTRIIAACPDKDTKKVAWVHVEFDKRSIPCAGFFNEQEMVNAYNRLDELVFVANRTHELFVELFPEIHVPMRVIHNVNDFDKIRELAKDRISIELDDRELNLCSVNRLFPVKGFDRLVEAFDRLNKEGLIDDVKLFIVGTGPEKVTIAQAINEKGLSDHIKLLGFDPNPYKYVSKMNLFVCTSYREGYSTATTEAIALGVPVFTTDCSGMEEILEDGKYGMIVPNDDDAIYEGLKKILTNRDIISDYATAIQSAPPMTTQASVDHYEEFFDSL